jgi:hypothetical protein
MARVNCQVAIIDDANINDRLASLAGGVQELLAELGRDVEVSEGPHWPVFMHPRPAVPMVAFVHWSRGAAPLLVGALQSTGRKRPDYSERIAAILAYRGEGSVLIVPVMKTLGLAPSRLLKNPVKTDRIRRREEPADAGS